MICAFCVTLFLFVCFVCSPTISIHSVSSLQSLTLGTRSVFCSSPHNLVSDTGHKSAFLWIILMGYEPCAPGTLGLPIRPPSCFCAIFYSCYFDFHTPSLYSSPRTRSLALPSHPQPIPVLMADDSTSSSTPSFPKLCSSNYSTWKGKMKAFLHTKSLWTIVSGAESALMTLRLTSRLSGTLELTRLQDSSTFCSLQSKGPI